MAQPSDVQQSIRRVRFFMLAVAFWAVLIVGRLFQLQVLQSDELLRQAQMQQEGWRPVPALRGNIFDRHGRPLATTLAVYAVAIDPEIFPGLDRAEKAKMTEDEKLRRSVRTLAAQLDIPESQLADKIRSLKRDNIERTKKGQVRRRFWMARRQVSVETTHRLKDLLREQKIRGVDFINDYKRIYPNREVAAHLLAGVKEYDLFSEDEEPVKKKDDCKDGHCNQGRGGLEYKFDEELAGRPGKARVFRANSRVEMDWTVVQPAVPGTDLYLTIDLEIQHTTEVELAESVKSHGAEAGTAIVVDPQTGDILALAHYPSFDPNERPDPERFSVRELRAVTAPFEPGSVFKIVTLTAGLGTGAVRTQTPVTCVKTLGKRVIHDDHPAAGLTAADTFIKSSNGCSVKIGFEVGPTRMLNFVKDLGFGARTGIELPGEHPGMMERPDLAKSKEPKEWSDNTLASVSFGHAIGTTSVQLAQMAGTIANGGKLIPPRLILSKRTPGKEPVLLPRPEAKRAISAEVAAEMRELMKRVVTDGTARDRVHLPGFSVGGKTGTAKRVSKSGKYVSEYNSSFVGITPVSRPALVGVVTLFGTRGIQGYGGLAAAPTFGRIMGHALRVLKIRPDLAEPEMQLAQQEEPQSKEKVEAPVKPEYVLPEPLRVITPPVQHAGMRTLVDLRGVPAPDFRGKSVRDVLEYATARGIRVRIMGRGLARAQTPAAGQWMAEDAQMTVMFGN